MSDSEDDLLYYRACEYVLRTGRVSVTAMQIEFGVGFYRAYGWVERMEANGFVTRPRTHLY